MKLATLLALFVTTLFSGPGWSQSISNSGIEIEYSYQTSFRSVARQTQVIIDNPAVEISRAVDPVKLANEHAGHVYGLFHSAYYMVEMGFPSDLSEGFVGTMTPIVENVESFAVEGDPYIWIRYRAYGRAILHKKAAAQWFKNNAVKNEITLPLLVNLPLVYTDDMKRYKKSRWKECTDYYFWKPYDFSYFYDPFYCKDLGQAPISAPTKFEVIKLDPPADQVVPTQAIHGDNENGKLITLYFVHGFDEVPRPGYHNKPNRDLYRDGGYKLYKNLETTLLEKYGFTKVSSLDEFREILGREFDNIHLIREVSLEHNYQRRYLSTFVRKDNDGKISVVRSGLFPSDNDEDLVTFPTFWKEAWENGDFIYYGGHSGDGTALSIHNMLKNIEKSKLDIVKDINFNPVKTQVAFFDACSSYAHFQQMYAQLKPSRLHVLTYGLVSLYHTAEATEQTMLEIIFSSKPIKWSNALEQIERAQLKPQMDYLYKTKSVATRKYRDYLERKLYPSSLLNVRVTDN